MTPLRRAAGGDLLADVKRRGVLVVSTDADYKPQSYRNADGSWTGFDIDVAREIAKRLGVKPEFQSVSFDITTAGSWSGRWDVNVDSMAITQGRAKVLYFTEPYYFVPASFAVHRDSSATSIADLNGKKIGVGAATTYEQYLNGQMSTARVPPPSGTYVVSYDTDMLALQDLALGNGVRLDGVLTALPTLRAAIAGGMPLRIISFPVYDDSSAIAIDRESPVDSRPLLWAIDGIVHDMHRDGTLRRLSMRYYGIDLSVRR
ncbi:MAG TPA: transporter substrate-binding domain-containing protein [Candidatus Eremiobacteraceae bacterium]|nr:transporter substrate-binding domain-containing protein [Candidatus Eremiobacteraceae bacterium]